MAILAFPMTFFAHRGMTRFVLSGKTRAKTSLKWWKNTSA
jgi:serine transporter